MAPVERRIRIGDWLIPYDDGTQSVTIPRTVADILKATPGNDRDCMNSRCIMAHKKAGVFPHPVFLVSTIKSRVYIVDQLDDAGEPAHAVRYELSARDSRLIGEHDKYAVGEPGDLTLRVPSDPKGSSHRAAFASGGGRGNRSGKHYAGKSKRPVTSVGAAARFKVAVGAFHEAQQA